LASLIEELTNTLRKEEEIYKNLIPIEEEKRNIIVKNDLIALEKITEQEQEVAGTLIQLEKKREEIVNNIGTVISKAPSDLNIRFIIQMLKEQPREQKELAKVYDSLSQTLERLVTINNGNKDLIKQSLDMIEFNMNFYHSLGGVANNSYNKGADGSDDNIYGAGIFDTKQ
jgi:flagellar biosynthesis/type III secretory pathway chaperone